MAGRPKGQEKTGGRKKGTPNRAEKVRQMFFDALDAVGGQLFIQQTAVKNPEAFIKTLSSILPKEVTGPEGGPIEHNVSGRVSIDLEGAKDAFSAAKARD